MADRAGLTLISLTAVGLLAGAGVASAHVTVNPSEAAAGGFTKLTFRVPNESPTAGTVALTVDLPTDHPFAYVSVKQVPGWTWSDHQDHAARAGHRGRHHDQGGRHLGHLDRDPGTQIGPGEFAEFDISAGPVPDAETLVFPPTQTYSDGEVVAVERADPRVRRGTGTPGADPDRQVRAATRPPRHTDGAVRGPAVAPTSAPVTTASISGLHRTDDYRAVMPGDRGGGAAGRRGGAAAAARRTREG